MKKVKNNVKKLEKFLQINKSDKKDFLEKDFLEKDFEDMCGYTKRQAQIATQNVFKYEHSF